MTAPTFDDLELLVPACAAAHYEEIGIDPMRHDPDGFRWRTRAQIDEGRSWVWIEDGVILFKAEASAWTPDAVQLQQVWVDPAARGRGNAQRGMRDLCRKLLEQVPRVCLFVRPENAPAIRVYEAVGTPPEDHCDACFTGRYPLGDPSEANGKFALELA